MGEMNTPKKLSIEWDEHHARLLLCEPEQLLSEEPWASWIKQQGGLNSVYTSIRNLPLSEKQRKTLAAILNDPGASLQKYALTLHISVATYVRYRSSLFETLVKVLNARMLDRQPSRSESVQAVASIPANLPYYHTPLIGRDYELASIHKRLLDDGVDLLTISGPGGIGKTRLALQAAANLLSEFGDGVFFVPLAAITNPDLVAASIAKALAMNVKEGQATVDLLKSYLRHRQMLLVLDNFEQITAAAPLLTDLLAAAPHLKILVTSRAVLHLYGEHEFCVPPLSVPDLERLPPVDVLAQSPAVALFVSRAQAVKASFRLTPENAAVIAEISVQLEGIPLALEIAAARIKFFSPQALLKGLSHRLTLLNQKSADLAPRHQTLRGAVAWSYQLLDSEEQTLFAQLGVFVGGCTLDAVESVCLLMNGPSSSFLDLMVSLADKSMLRVDVSADGETRFSMLETLREYALEQLDALGQTDGIQQRHLAFFLALVETIEPGPREPNLPAWMKRLEQEHDNLRAALQWALDHEGLDAALRIAGAVWRFWQIHGHVEEGGRWLKVVLDRSAGLCSLARSRALWGAGWLCMVSGALEQAGKYFEEGASISRQLGQTRYLGLALHGIGAVARGQGEFERSRLAFEESLPLFQALQSPEDVAWTFEHLGVSALEQGDFDRAVLYLSQGLALFRELDQRWPRAEALTFLGHAALQQKDYILAQRHYEAALTLYEEMEDNPNIATLNSCIGAALFGQGKTGQAIRLYRENLIQSQEMKDYWGMVWGIERLAEAAEKLEQPERAALLWGAADALRRLAGVLWHPGFHSDYTDRRFAALRSRLGETFWQQLWNEGQEMPVEQVVACALAVG